MHYLEQVTVNEVLAAAEHAFAAIQSPGHVTVVENPDCGDKAFDVDTPATGVFTLIVFYGTREVRVIGGSRNIPCIVYQIVMYREIPATRWNPPEVEDQVLDNYYSLFDAMAGMVEEVVRWRLQNAAEAYSYRNVPDYSVEEV